MSEENMVKIDEVITHYFNTSTSVDRIPAKAIMPALIDAGVFNKDKKRVTNSQSISEIIPGTGAC